MKKTNLLLLTTDEQRFDYLGTNQRTPVATPNPNRLASEGAQHTNAYTVNPLCMPARCSLLTGLYSHQHGIMNNRGDLDPKTPTMTEELQKLGYYTALIGKEHFFEGFIDLTAAEPYSKKHFGFDYMWPVAGKSMVAGLYDYPDYSDDAWTYYLQEQGLTLFSLDLFLWSAFPF